MIKKIMLNGVEVEYELQRKTVKNINLRITRDGQIRVSASRMVPQRVINGFISSKAEFILNALAKCESRQAAPKIQYFGEHEIRAVIEDMCRSAYPYYSRFGIEYPQVKFRRMVSRWGSCCAAKGVLTFNTNLMYVPCECVEYVVWHEFTHFLQQNHSPRFYEELEKVCPDWKACRKKLREISIRQNKS